MKFLLVIMLLINITSNTEDFVNKCQTYVYNGNWCYAFNLMVANSQILANENKRKLNDVEKTVESNFEKIYKNLDEILLYKQKIEQIQTTIESYHNIMKQLIDIKFSTLNQVPTGNQHMILNNLKEHFESVLNTKTGEISNTLINFTPKNIAEETAQLVDKNQIINKQIVDKTRGINNAVTEILTEVRKVKTELEDLRGMIRGNKIH